MINTHIHEPGISEARARMIHYQGLLKYREKRYGEGIRYMMYAKTFCNPDGFEAARILDSLAVHYDRTNDYTRAIQCLRQSLGIKEHGAPDYQKAISSQILGRIYISNEDYVEAEDCLQRARKISEQLSDFKRVARIQNDLIRLYIYRGDIPEALTLIKEFDSRKELKDLRVQYGTAMLYKCFIVYNTGEYQTCQDMLCRDVLPIFRKHENKKGLGKTKRLLASIEHYIGDNHKAIEMMSQVISLFREENLVDELAKTYFEMGKIYASMNETGLALTTMMEALKIAELNGLTYLRSYIEDEIFRLDEAKWQEIVHKRANHERVFDKETDLVEALTIMGSQGEMAQSSKSFISLLRVGQAMAAERDLEKLLEVIKTQTEEALDADRCTVFLYDIDKNELWSKVATGLDTVEEIRFPAHLGLAGYVAKTGEVLNIKDAYADPRFNPEIDRRTGYKTNNILCMPMRNRQMDIIGVFQVLNKADGAFEKSDEDLLATIASSGAVAIENATLTKEMKFSFDSFVKTLSSTIDARDPITAGHSERVAEYSILIGEQMEMAKPDIEALKYASLLHDIGKIGIREDILKKDGRLTEKEYRHIQKHVYYTHEILKNVHFERHLMSVPEIAASHHEKMDGTGYHRGLKGEDIPLSGRILAISDVFDAITSRRHYRARMPFDRVLSILKKDAGTHFDPDCVESFFQIKLLSLGKILLMEKKGVSHDQLGMTLLSKVDPHVTVTEFFEITNKSQMTQGEADVHRNFAKLYHRAEMSNMD